MTDLIRSTGKLPKGRKVHSQRPLPSTEERPAFQPKGYGKGKMYCHECHRVTPVALRDINTEFCANCLRKPAVLRREPAYLDAPLTFERRIKEVWTKLDKAYARKLAARKHAIDHARPANFSETGKGHRLHAGGRGRGFQA